MRRSWFVALVLLLFVGVIHASAQTRMLVGRVTDTVTTQPIANGLVRVLGTPIQVPLRNDGTFILYLPVREVTLAIESPGYQTTEVRVQSREETVLVPIRRDVFELSRIVVTGEATGVERRNLSNAISQIGAEDLSRVPAQSVHEAMKGKMTGVQVTGGTGAPGGGLQLRLRGITSIIGNTDPLFIVDGVIVSNVAIPGGANAVTQAERGVIASMQENPLNRLADLNPNDIENIEVLKGASASAMYGSKASNGVVIITTKHGHFRPRVTPGRGNN